MLKRHRITLACTLLLGLWPVVGVPGVACAGDGPSAALVVDTGDSVTRYCVALDAPSVSGVHLVELAGQQHGMPYSLGFGGKAVCMLENVGPTSDDCFEQYPDFWGYWRGDDSGGWAWSGSGAGSTKVSDGDVEGWSWGSGQDGSSHQAPPPTTFAAVCGSDEGQKPASGGGDKAEPKVDDHKSSPGASGEVTEGNENDDGTPAPDEKGTGKKKRAKTDGETPKTKPSTGGGETTSPGSTSVDLTAGPHTGDDDGGPPAAGMVALGASALLGGLAFLKARRRRSV